MPSKQTTNYKLSQWVKTDKVLMDDFNDDNAKIDDAIRKVDARVDGLSASKADASALESLARTVADHTTALAGKGNCQLYTTSYPGTGTSGADAPNKLTFPGQPIVVFIAERSGGNATFMVAINGQTRVAAHNNSISYNAVTWSGKTMTWYSSSGVIGQMNHQDLNYVVAALIAV